MVEIFYSNIENLVLPPGCRPYPTGRKPGHVRDDRLSHWPNLYLVSGVRCQGRRWLEKQPG
jgi:hypothetical protein